MGFVLRVPSLEVQVIEAISSLLPVSSDYITTTIRGVVNARGAIGAVATIGVIWSETSVFNAVRKSINTAWGIRKPRPFLYDRLLEIAMMIGTGLLLLVSIVLTAGLQAIHQLKLHVVGFMTFNNDLFRTFMVTLISTAITYTVFLLLFKFVPNTSVKWKDIWIGALAATVCFDFTKSIFIWFVGTFGKYNLVYGSIGALIALLIWCYISALILLFFAKLTSVYTRTIPSEHSK